MSKRFIAPVCERFSRGEAVEKISHALSLRPCVVRAILRSADLMPPTSKPGRVQWPLPQPQPTTPLQGEVEVLTFDEYQRARMGGATPAVQRLFDTFGAYAVKPKRASAGLVWGNRAFWWSNKGYYRPGKSDNRRRPLQHYIYEEAHGPMPRGHEIFFRDRDRHNFRLENLELLSKAELHQRTISLGEVGSLGFAERSEIRGRWACRKSRDLTALLLQRTNTTNEHGDHRITHTLKR